MSSHGNLRHKLGRTNDLSSYRSTLFTTPFSWKARLRPVDPSDPRHIKTAG
ncbi:MAG: hypothetical protein K2X72_15025 [Reyranella sp.]|nr:hypothetical protein [Reyranella sp.]